MTESISQLSVRECLTQMTEWLKAREPFFHTRYNDGEWISMFQLRRENQRCPRHQYTKEIREALRTTHDEIIQAVIANQKNILLGSNWSIAQKFGGKQYEAYISKFPKFLANVTWTPGDSWYTRQDEVENNVSDKGILILLDELREGNHNTVFVANSQLAQASYCLGAHHVAIPSMDGWLDHKHIITDCLQSGESNSTYVWCAGFPGKVLSWKVWKARPNTSHINFGSVLDCVFHVGVTNWMLREGDDIHYHKKFVEQVIEPYVRSFIPGN